MKYAVRIDGMHCAHCAKAVEKELGTLGGVTAVSINLAEGIAFVSTDNELKEDNVADAVDDVGFDFVSMAAC